jgi:hypothetical protein
MQLVVYNVPPEADVDIQQWAEITIEKWQWNIVSRNLINTAELLNSFSTAVSTDANGDTALITFAFNYYLRMIDMGVGRGTTKNDAADVADARRERGFVKGNRRKPQPVFLKTFYAEVMRLNELFTEKYAAQGAYALINEITM